MVVPLPEIVPGRPVIYHEPVLQGGGTSANTAVALRKLGIPTDFMGTLGDDTYGRYLIDEFVSRGIGVDSLIVDPNLNTICVFAFIDKTGERYLWGWPRVKQAFKELDAGRINWNTVDAARWIHSSGMVLTYDTGARWNVIRIFKYAHERGIPTSFDLNLRADGGVLDGAFRDAILEIMEYCTYVLGSGAEEFSYLGSGDNWHDNAASLVRENRTIVVRMGKDGSVAMSSGGVWEAEGFPVEVVDTVGAGDVFNAGFIAALLAGKTLEESIIWGNGVAGFQVARKGAWSTPSFEELQDFFKIHNYREAESWGLKPQHKTVIGEIMK
jgi:fructokinase